MSQGLEFLIFSQIINRDKNQIRIKKQNWNNELGFLFFIVIHKTYSKIILFVTLRKHSAQVLRLKEFQEKERTPPPDSFLQRRGGYFLS